jgi:hypothetical protein
MTGGFLWSVGCRFERNRSYGLDGWLVFACSLFENVKVEVAYKLAKAPLCVGQPDPQNQARLSNCFSDSFLQFV